VLNGQRKAGCKKITLDGKDDLGREVGVFLNFIWWRFPRTGKMIRLK